MKSTSHLPWAKKEQATKEIDLESLFNMYWTSKARELTVTGSSYSPTTPLIHLMEKRRGGCHWEPQFLSRFTIPRKC